jgi:hypothetical protein
VGLTGELLNCSTYSKQFKKGKDIPALKNLSN